MLAAELSTSGPRRIRHAEAENRLAASYRQWWICVVNGCAKEECSGRWTSATLTPQGVTLAAGGFQVEHQVLHVQPKLAEGLLDRLHNETSSLSAFDDTFEKGSDLLSMFRRQVGDNFDQSSHVSWQFFRPMELFRRLEHCDCVPAHRIFQYSRPRQDQLPAVPVPASHRRRVIAVTDCISKL